ncbi:MAG: T9SS type A sorting domain-containing protein, partial [Flavobacteriales bacterium]|nr:T9SS type A sorting domain-containing protein [Flavobacteriales bacterium]
ITINGTLNTTSGSFFNGNNSAINGIGTIFFNTGSFTNNGTLNGTVDPVNGTVDLGNTGLSVEFAAFEAFTKGENVVLKWYTTSEIDNDHFQIERSTNNSEFEIIGMVEGAINSSVWRSYEFVDESPIQKATYYRIKQVDLDGNSSQTQSRLVVDHLNDKTDKVSVIAMSNGFILSNLSDNAVDLSVFDITGRVILQKQINRSFEYTNTESSGIYFVSFADTKGKISTQKFLFTK